VMVELVHLAQDFGQYAHLRQWYTQLRRHDASSIQTWEYRIELLKLARDLGDTGYLTDFFQRWQFTTDDELARTKKAGRFRSARERRLDVGQVRVDDLRELRRMAEEFGGVSLI